MSIAIETKDLKRAYKTYRKEEGLLNSIKGIWNRRYDEKVALDKTNIQIESGKIIGLVGANGAGKTTLLKILSGLVVPSSGEAKVLGFTPWERNYDFLRQISILLGQKNQLWWDISPADSFSLLGKIYDIENSKCKKKVSELAEMLNCTHVLNTQLRRLSLGERMKMEIIGSLLHEPKVLFLDEPTIGLDIVAQESIRNFLSSYVKDKAPTIILTSHYMDDIATLADRLLLISKGNIVYQGTVKEFVKNKNSELAKHEEVDFEEVIRRFLETESRVF
jgi:ABC-2 type transport system ATP-binding protein